MDPNRWKQVDALLEAALEQPSEKRKAFVVAACEDNAELRDEVLSLVKAQSRASKFMERSAMRVAAASLAQDSSLTTSVSLIGKELSTYRIERLLGAGGMGEVYLARESKLNRMVALKILPWHFVGDVERSNRFQREARALSSFNHPNLTTIYEVGEANGLHFIAMEYVEGKTLAAMRQSLSLKGLLSIVAQVAEALWAAHQAGIVHRDIKPDNIMVRSDGYVKVLDFGLVKLTEAAKDAATNNSARTERGVAMGTLAYMSPEQAAGEAIDHRTDIWSLGVVLYEFAAGEKPFATETRQGTINAILSNDPKPVSSIDNNLPAELDPILNKALEKDKDLRYQTASDFRADIRRLTRAIDSSATRSSSRSITRPIRHLVRRNWFWPVVAIGLLCLTVPLVFIFMRPKSSGPDWSRAASVQLTGQPGTEYFPSIAPDGKGFVYASEQSGNSDLFFQRVGGRNSDSLTPNTPSDETEPAYSPDGERIAFRSTREPAGIYVMEATGENVRLVTAGCHHPSWSPDGKDIVCSTRGQSIPTFRNPSPSALWVVNVDTGGKRVLTEGDAMQPAWSPSGARVAFWFRPPQAGRADVATIASSGGEIEVVTRDASTNWNPVWSPDGKFLYFASDRSGNMSFWRVAIDEKTGKVEGEPEAVSTPSTFSRHLNFSRDGRRLIYVQTVQRSNVQAIKFDPNSEKTLGEPFGITLGDRRVLRPELSPDDTRFVMLVSRRTQDDIAVVNRDGSNWRDLTNDRFFDRWPRWSPDGKKIAFTSDRGVQYEIWLMDADGTNLRQLTFDSPGDASFPIWSADGTQILFRRNRVNTIVDVNKAWSERSLRQLPEPGNGERFGPWDWSPDGKKLLGTIGTVGNVQGRVGYFSLEKNQYERFDHFGGTPMWLSDSTRFIFLSGRKVYLTDINTKQVREVFTLEEETIGGLGISSDGQLLYFTASSSESDIWLLDLR
ncbi:MAG TPA: LpqB family beta-propeller domain-containing protein [Pyrinomonadaceae bacterium]